MIVLVHGIGDSGADMAPITEALSGQAHVYAPSRRRLPPTAMFDETVDDFVKQLAEENVGPAYFLGYSFGGLIALTIARRHPERVRGVIGLAAKIVYDETTMGHLSHIVSAPRLRQTIGHKVPAYEQRWGVDLDTLAWSAMNMYAGIHANPPVSDEDLRAIEVPVLLLSGEQDQVVTAAETRHVGGLLPNARIDFFQGQAHPMRKVPVDHVKTSVLNFVREVDEGSFAPTGAKPKMRAWLG